MEEELAEAALKLQRSAFVERVARWFLILPAKDAPQPSVRFRTAVYDYMKPPIVAAEHDSEGLALKSPRWNGTPWVPQGLSKRAGSPFSSRVSIGRAPNVDVVIRSPFVSKLHAHFILENEQQIVDLGSQNGTFLNGTRLLANKAEKISNGDIISFGQVHCEFATSDVLYYALRRKYLALLQSVRPPRPG